jgi:hypothetical protein
MVLGMKTTVELPDQLLIEAKKRAAELRVPLKSIIEESLRSGLRSLRKPDRVREEPAEYGVVWSGRLDIDLPDEVRERLGITETTDFTAVVEGDHLVLTPITEAAIRNLRGMFEGSGLLEELIRMRREEP